MKTNLNKIVEEISEEELNKIGAELASMLELKRDREHKDRWQTGYGNKTNIGLARTILDVASDVLNKTK